MAPLVTPHWQVISPEIHRLITLLGRQAFVHRFYLAGGTALALQLGHRQSIDLDFFSEMDEVDERSRMEVIAALQPSGVQVIENVGGNLLLLANGIRVGFFSYAYPLIQDFLTLENVPLASVTDIGLMKCDALITRGSRKDFYDLFFIARQISLDRLLEYGQVKYAYYRDFALSVIERMVMFDNADRDVQPELFEEIPWQGVKNFFIQEAKHLGRSWLGS
jgi:predicted nucleotidyltransferase component of viral defense system